MKNERVPGIEIIATPWSLTPDIASVWIGVRIPFPVGFRSKDPERFYVDAQTAIRQLAKKNPHAAEIIKGVYEKSLPSMGLFWFSFERAVCKEVTLAVDYT